MKNVLIVTLQLMLVIQEIRKKNQPIKKLASSSRTVHFDSSKCFSIWLDLLRYNPSACNTHNYCTKPITHTECYIHVAATCSELGSFPCMFFALFFMHVLPCKHVAMQNNICIVEHINMHFFECINKQAHLINCMES